MPDLLIEGLAFGEGPRWRDGALWLSDMHAQKVLKVIPGGQAQTIVELKDDQPSGLGWLPNGDLLIVSMTKRSLLKYDGSILTTHADLSGLASWYCNDMVVDKIGRAYVGNFGFDLEERQPFRPADLALVRPPAHCDHAQVCKRAASRGPLSGSRVGIRLPLSHRRFAPPTCPLRRSIPCAQS